MQGLKQREARLYNGMDTVYLVFLLCHVQLVCIIFLQENNISDHEETSQKPHSLFPLTWIFFIMFSQSLKVMYQICNIHIQGDGDEENTT